MRDYTASAGTCGHGTNAFNGIVDLKKLYTIFYVLGMRIEMLNVVESATTLWPIKSKKSIFYSVVHKI